VTENSYFEISDGPGSGEESQAENDALDSDGKCRCKATMLIVDDSSFNLVPLKMILKSKLSILCDQGEDGLQEVSMFIKN
jgi:hypothetical protein